MFLTGAFSFLIDARKKLAGVLLSVKDFKPGPIFAWVYTFGAILSTSPAGHFHKMHIFHKILTNAKD